MDDVQDMGQPGPGDGDGQPVLKDEDKTRLVGIIRQMKANSEPEERIQRAVSLFKQKYGTTSLTPQEDALKALRQPLAPAQQPKAASDAPEGRAMEDLKQQAQQVLNPDEVTKARQQLYATSRKEAIAQVESPAWRDKVFTGKIPAMTDDPNMPAQAYQTVNTGGLDEYLKTLPLNDKDKYWLRNQLINYGQQRQAKYFIDKAALKNLGDVPQVKEAQDKAKTLMMEGKIPAEKYDETWKAVLKAHPELENDANAAYLKATKDYGRLQEESVANQLNNTGLFGHPLSVDAPFHDQITGANKAVMGAMNFVGDTGHQVSALLELTGSSGSQLGYSLKSKADDLKAHNYIPQNGEAGNLLAGTIEPMALNMAAMQLGAGALGRPLYEALASARAAGTFGKFAEGALGGLAMSPANSYLIARQHYDDLVKGGEDPATAASKSDQLLGKNLATDMFIMPLQMGLLKIPAGSWTSKALGIGGESAVAGLHFTLQDFNQKSADNPAMSILDYVQKDPDKYGTFLTGAVLGGLQKAATDTYHGWDQRSQERNMFQYGRKYGADSHADLPNNQTIAGNVLSALEMKDTQGRAGELKQLVSALRDGGIYQPDEAARVSGIIDDVDAVRKQVPKFGSPEQKLAVMNELLQQRALEPFLANAGNEAAAKPIEEAKKQSQNRIAKIMSGEEPLYFVNGNETNKADLLEHAEQHPDILSAKGFKITVHNDPETAQKLVDLKTQYDAVQKQKSAAADVRPASGDSPAVEPGNEGQGTINQEAAKQGGGANAEGQGPPKIEEAKPEKLPVTDHPDPFQEARHSEAVFDLEHKVSGQDEGGLSEKGQKDAIALGKELKDYGITKIIGSDLPRNLETVDAIRDQIGMDIPHEIRPSLRSWDLGDFRGMDDAEFRKVQEHFVNNPDLTEYDGKKLGESFNQYKDRVISAMHELQTEGPETLVVNHSNNMMIWDAFKNNGEWNEKAAKDYLEAKSPEPATLRVRKGEQEVAQAAEGMSDKELLPIIKKAIDETRQSAEPVQPRDQSEAGSDQADGETRQFSKAPGYEEDLSASGEGEGAAKRNQGGKPLPGDTEPPDPARLTKTAVRFLSEGRTDEHVMTYLERKGLDEATSRAVLGEAHTHPVFEDIKAGAQKEVMAHYNQKEDAWLGRRDLNKLEAIQEARRLQDRIKATVPKGTNSNDIDKAIHIYLDLQQNPEHLKEYYDKLNPEQKRIADLSQHLTAEQKDIAAEIDTQYSELGKEAKDNGIIQSVIENYVARAWDTKAGKPATEESFKFSTSTKHSLHRTLETILQGQAEGMNLRVQGATNNLAILKQEIGSVIENQRHLEQGLALKYDSGQLDSKGKPIKQTLFSTTQENGYAKIENPSFKRWERAGKLKDYSAEEAQAFGRRRDVMITPEGEVMKKSDVYAPKEVATSLNNILGSSRLNGVPGVQALTRFGAAVKQSMLSYSGFHFIAFTRAHLLSATLKDFRAANPISAYKAGLNMLTEQHPFVQELVAHGMTVNRRQDFTEGVTAHNTWLGKQLDRLSTTKAVKDKMIGLNTQFHKYLFDTYGGGLKTFDGVNLAKKELQGRSLYLVPKAERDAVFKRVAKLMNDTYGGINWERMRGTSMQNPTVRHLSSLLLLAPDWTASNLRFAVKSFNSGQEGGLYRKTWARVILRGAMLTTAANAIMATWDEKDDQGNTLSWSDAMARRYGKAWNAGKLRFTMVDISPMYHWFGGDPGKRAYFSVMGAYTDPMKMVSSPADFLEAKTSFVSKLALEGATSENWQHKEFTTLDELTGLDDKGTYTKTVTAHKQGEYSEATGEPYKRDQTGHQEGEAKGGKLGGQLTKWSQGGAHPLHWGQAPSFILSQARGMTPNAIQALWQLAAGENDATTSIMNAVGSGILTNKDPAAKKVDNQTQP